MGSCTRLWDCNVAMHTIAPHGAVIIAVLHGLYVIIEECRPSFPSRRAAARTDAEMRRCSTYTSSVLRWPLLWSTCPGFPTAQPSDGQSVAKSRIAQDVSPWQAQEQARLEAPLLGVVRVLGLLLAADAHQQRAAMDGAGHVVVTPSLLPLVQDKY